MKQIKKQKMKMKETLGRRWSLPFVEPAAAAAQGGGACAQQQLPGVV